VRKHQGSDRAIGELEDLLKQRDRSIFELRQEAEENQALIAEMRGHVQDADDIIEAWKESFGMRPAPAGEPGPRHPVGAEGHVMSATPKLIADLASRFPAAFVVDARPAIVLPRALPDNGPASGRSSEPESSRRSSNGNFKLARKYGVFLSSTFKASFKWRTAR
jgi:hypothetical protein